MVSNEKRNNQSSQGCRCNDGESDITSGICKSLV